MATLDIRSVKSGCIGISPASPIISPTDKVTEESAFNEKGPTDQIVFTASPSSSAL